MEVSNLTHRLLYPTKEMLTKQKTTLALELIWTFQRREKSLASTRIQIPDCPPSSLVTIPTTTFIHITMKIMHVTQCINLSFVLLFTILSSLCALTYQYNHCAIFHDIQFGLPKHWMLTDNDHMGSN